MAKSFRTLYQALLTVTTAVTTYTVPAATNSILATITVVNVSTSTPATIKVWQTPTAATAVGDAYVIQPTITLQAGEKMVMTGPKTISDGVTIKVQSSVANVLNCLIEGAELT